VLAAYSMRCQNKVVVVTGASMGIGEAVARVFVAEGAHVVMSSRDITRVEEARNRIGTPDRTLAVACDVRDRRQVEALVQTTKESLGKIDVWINNAGYGLQDSVASVSIEECKRMFDTNLFGTIECMQVVIPVMKSQSGGAIINISSVAGHVALPYMGAYAATKHALNAISQSARLELESSGIDVISVCPGRIETNFGENAVKGKEGRMLGKSIKQATPERCAQAILQGYLKRKREVFVPWHGWWISHLYEMFPAVIEFGMRRMMR
jgi:short-subunit dehydrogenase